MGLHLTDKKMQFKIIHRLMLTKLNIFWKYSNQDECQRTEYSLDPNLNMNVLRNIAQNVGYNIPKR